MVLWIFGGHDGNLHGGSRPGCDRPGPRPAGKRKVHVGSTSANAKHANHARCDRRQRRGPLGPGPSWVSRISCPPLGEISPGKGGS